MMKSIYLLRHGETEYNRKGVLQGRAIDAPLNETGKRQSQAFYEKYRDVPFDLVISSELIRSKESIKAFVDDRIPYIIDSRITEFSWGDNEGLPLNDIVFNNYRKMLESWNRGELDARIPGGESGLELQSRVREFVDQLAEKEENTILICTHGRTLKMLIVEMLKKEIGEMDSIRHSNSALFMLNYEKGEFILRLTNDISHLPAELQRNTFWDK